MTARVAFLLLAAPVNCSIQSPVPSEGAVDSIQLREFIIIQAYWLWSVEQRVGERLM